MVHRQRATVMDDFLLLTVFPFLESTGVRSLVRLPRIWSKPVVRHRATSSVETVSPKEETR
jgi:hypothetical protein